MNGERCPDPGEYWLRKGQLLALVLICSLIFGFLGLIDIASAAPAKSVDESVLKASSPAEVIQLVNQLRAANGLPKYKVNNKLMAAAQAHSNYQASIGSVTHTGTGGTRPRDRAIAAGYGGGASVFVSENIMSGTNLTAQKAVQWWQGDAPHTNTMLSTNYQDAGAGVAVSGGVVYITLDVGYVAGAAAPPSPKEISSPLLGEAAIPAATREIVISIEVANPDPDGSIVHVVQEGQVLVAIAKIYQVELSDLLALNGLTMESVIYPGENLLIKPAQATPTTTILSRTEMPTLTKEALLPTLRPSRTVEVVSSGHILDATPVSMVSSEGEVALLEDGLGSPSASADPQGGIDILLIVIVVLVVLGTGLLLAGSLLKRNT
jgi:hypothetical protein